MAVTRKKYPKNATAEVILKDMHDPMQVIGNTAETDNVHSPAFIPRILEHYKKLDGPSFSKKWEKLDEKTPSPWQEVLVWSKMFAKQTEAVDNNKRDKNEQKKMLLATDKLYEALNGLAKISISPDDKNAQNAIKGIVCVLQGLYERGVAKDKENWFGSTGKIFDTTKKTRIQSLAGIHQVALSLATKVGDPQFVKTMQAADSALQNDVVTINQKYNATPEDIQKKRVEFNISKEDYEKLEKEARSLHVPDKKSESSTKNMLARTTTDQLETTILSLTEMGNAIEREPSASLTFNAATAQQLGLTEEEKNKWQANNQQVLESEQKSDISIPVVGSFIKGGIIAVMWLQGEYTKIADETAMVNAMLSKKIEDKVVDLHGLNFMLSELKRNLDEFVVGKDDKIKRIIGDIHKDIHAERMKFTDPVLCLDNIKKILAVAQKNSKPFFGKSKLDVEILSDAQSLVEAYRDELSKKLPEAKEEKQAAKVNLPQHAFTVDQPKVDSSTSTQTRFRPGSR